MSGEDGPFTACKAVRRNGTGSYMLPLDYEWGLVKGDVVEISVCRQGVPVGEGNLLHIAEKKVQSRSKTPFVYCDRRWGYEPGDLVQFMVRRIARADRGGGAQEEPEALP